MEQYADKMYVHARVMALHADMLKKNDYADIAHTKNIQKALPGYSSDINTENYIAVKEKIFNHHIKKLIILTKASKDYRHLFKAFLLLFDRENIKQMLSKAFNRGVIISQRFEVAPFQVMPADFAQRSVTAEEAIAVLNNTLRLGLPAKDSTFEMVEVALDFYCYALIAQCARRYMPGDRNKLRVLLSIRTELIRRTWSLRLRHLYRWSQDDIDDFLLSRESLYGFQSLTPAQTRAVEKALAGFSVDGASGWGGDGEPDERLIQEEIRSEKYFYRVLKKTIRLDFHSIWPVISYLWLLYYQIYNLFRVIEAVRFGIRPEIIMQSVICED